MDDRTFSLARGASRAGRLIANRQPDSRSIKCAPGAAALYAAWLAAILPPANGVLLALALCPASALTIAFLLRARLRNEWLLTGAVWAAIAAVLLASGRGGRAAAILPLASIAQVLITVPLTRFWCCRKPDITRIGDLGKFVWAGGVIGPAVSAIIAGFATGPDADGLQMDVMVWAFTASTAVILIVPPVLLLFGTIPARTPRSAGSQTETAALFVAGMICTYMTFRQPALSLLFLIHPITLLHACRLNSRSTAVYVLAAATIAVLATLQGSGPIAAVAASRTEQLLFLALFLATNFLTGLPVSVILLSRADVIARLAEGKRRLDMLANNIGDAVLHYDRNGVCTYATPSARDVLGAEAEDHVGQRFEAWLQPQASATANAMIDRLFSGQVEHERLTCRRFGDDNDGSPVFVEADCTCVREAGTDRVTGIVLAVRDVTERIRLTEQLTQAREQAEQGAQIKSDFLANMSHEIRKPMNGVLGFAEMMLQGDMPPEQRRFAELIVRSGRSMMLLLNDVLDLSKIEAGQFIIDEGPVDLAATLAECAALHRPDAEKKGIDLIVSCDCGDDTGQQPDDRAGQWIITDGLRLRQIVLNLLGNSVKFTDVGTIRLTYRIAPDTITIMAEDTGMGITPGRLETIFDPFNQSEGDIARQFGGTGLGLSISRKLAELLGGTITVTSAPAAGSCFSLTLPARFAPQPVPAEPGGHRQVAVAMPPGERILLADHHDVNRLLMTEMLERCGQTVAIAYDGTEAISMVIDSIMRAQPYDLVLMDVQMPGCDGYAATRAIRGSGVGADMLPIIALTANAFPGDIATARAAGMQGHLAKPVAMSDLARTLQRWLPSRIVETTGPDGDAALPHCAAVRGVSAHTAAQWIANRQQACEAIGEAFARGCAETSHTETLQGSKLLLMIRDLAGTAPLFGEAELGDCAAALEHALRQGATASACAALAQDLLALLSQPTGQVREPAR